MYYVYILRSIRTGKIYIGYSIDLKVRLSSHNSGKNKATRPFKPYELIFYEAFLNRVDAKNREKYLKTGFGLRSIKKMLKRYFDQQ